MRSAILTRTKVLEFCLETAAGALEVAAELVKSCPDTALKVLTESDLAANTSVLHVIVPEDKLDEFVGSYAYILGHAGRVLMSTGTSAA